MSKTTPEFLALMERSARFEYHQGGSTLVAPLHSTGWRVMPALLVSFLGFHGKYELVDRAPITLRPGDTLCAVPGLRHCVSAVGRKSGISHWSHTQCEIFQGVSLFFLLEPLLVIRGERSERLADINRQLGEIAAAELSVPALLRRQALGWNLITTLLEGATFRREPVELIRHASRLTPVLAFVEKNLAQPLTHEQLARVAGLSPSRFHFLFRAALGFAPYAYIQKLRLKKAQELLLRTDKSVAQIGQEVGHPDPYHFSRMFRRSMGISPAGYRKQITRRSL